MHLLIMQLNLSISIMPILKLYSLALLLHLAKIIATMKYIKLATFLEQAQKVT